MFAQTWIKQKNNLIKEEFSRNCDPMDAFRPNNTQKSIDERAMHTREYDNKVNERRMQSKEGKHDSSKTLDANLVVTESNERESEIHVSSSRSGKDTHAKDADVNSMNDKQPIAEGGEIDQECLNARKMTSFMSFTDPSLVIDNITTKFSNQFLESENISLKKTVAQLQKDFSRMETHCVNMELKYQNQVLKNGQHGQILNETSNKAKIKKEIEVLETINIELEHSVAKLLAENKKLHKENEHLKQTYKDLYDSIKKTRVQTKDHNDSLIAQINITQHYLPKGKESAFAKPNHMISSSSSRNSFKNMPRFSSNDMVHNHYLEEAQKKTQEKNRNSEYSVMHSTRLQNTTNNHKPKLRSLQDRSSLDKSFAVHERPITPRSCLRWKPTGRIFKTAGLRWIPMGKKFTSSTNKVDSEPPNSLNEDITNPYECEQTLNVNADTLNLSTGPALYEITPATIGSGLVPNSPPSTPFVPPLRSNWDLLFQPPFDELLTPLPSVDHPAPEVIALVDKVVSP
ncbi:hypothetical protein Tco_0033744, partial [Tanacetum coccineum]